MTDSRPPEVSDRPVDRRLRRRTAAALLVGLSLVLVDRLLVLASSGHLMFDVNQAEYGYLSAIIPWIPVHLWEIISDAGLRHQFFRDCISVGNQVHGTLGLAGLATLWGTQLFDTPLSTTLVRGLALGQSMLALTLWAWTVGRVTRSAGVVLGFCLLWMFAPIVPLKVSMLWWGTHDAVVLMSAIWIAVLLPMVEHPSRGKLRMLQAATLGVVGGVISLTNHSLLMPVVAGLLFFGCMPFLELRARRLRWPSALAICLATLTVMALSHQLVVRGIMQSGFLEGLGYPRSVSSSHVLGLTGKRGASFLHEAGEGWREWSTWRSEVWPIAVRQAPSEAYGPTAATAETVARLGAVGLGLLLVCRYVYRAVRGKRDLSGAAGAFVGLYLPLAAIATGFLALRYSPDVGGHPHPEPRYFAHLYPFAMATVAMAGCMPGRGRWLRVCLLGWPLWLGAFDHNRLIDLALVRDRLAVPYEAAPLYFRARPGRLPPAGFSVWPDASEAFVDGYALIEEVQFRRYWRWLEPAELTTSGALQAELGRSLNRSVESPAHWRGVGAALRVIVPPERQKLVRGLPMPPGTRAYVLEGYNDPVSARAAD